MPRIKLKEELSGIIALFDFNQKTARILGELAEELLRGESTLLPWERELIAAHVSYTNGCNFCFNSHAAAVNAFVGNNEITEAMIEGADHAAISLKLKSLLELAQGVTEFEDTADAVEEAKNHGATDEEIHTTVLIAAAFCMFNRYVDGLATESSENTEDYIEIGENLAKNGYVATKPVLETQEG